MEQFLNKHILKIAIIISLPLMAAWAFADDHNYTFHGHQIDVVEKPDIIFTGNIRNAYSTSNDTIVIEMRDRKKYTLTVSFCWDLPVATGYIFGRQGVSKHFNRVEKGLRVYTMDGFGRIDTHSCIVTDVRALEDV